MVPKEGWAQWLDSKSLLPGSTDQKLASSRKRLLERLSQVSLKVVDTIVGNLRQKVGLKILNRHRRVVSGISSEDQAAGSCRSVGFLVVYLAAAPREHM